MKASSSANTNVGKSHNGGKFVASAGLFVCVLPLQMETHTEAGMRGISDAAPSAYTQKGEERKCSGGNVMTHFRLMQEATLELFG